MASLVARIAERAATRTQNAIVARFVEGDATSPSEAIRFVPEGTAQTRTFEHMRRFGAIVATDDDKYWIDPPALANFRKEALARVLGAIAVAGFAAAGAMALGR